MYLFVAGFVGDACSASANGAPIITTVSSRDLCDVRESSCINVQFNALNFDISSNFTCRAVSVGIFYSFNDFANHDQVSCLLFFKNCQNHCKKKPYQFLTMCKGHHNRGNDR
jgi:hypothetical protein